MTDLTMSFFKKLFLGCWFVCFLNLSLKENCPHLFSVDVFRDVHATLGRHSELGTTPAVISRLGVSFGLYYKSSNRLKVEYNQHKFLLPGWLDWGEPLTIRFIRYVFFFLAVS